MLNRLHIDEISQRFAFVLISRKVEQLSFECRHHEIVRVRESVRSSRAKVDWM